MAGKYFRTEAIIIKTVLYGERDKIVTFLDCNEGKLSGFASSAVTSRKRFGGQLDIGSVVKLGYTVRSGSLVELREAVPVLDMPASSKSLLQMAAIMYAVELVDMFVYENQPSTKKYNLLREFIRLCGRANPRQVLVRAFEAKLLTLSGYRPLLDECIVCGLEIVPGKVVFSRMLGGVLCSNCLRRSGDCVDLARELPAFVKRLIYTPLKLVQSGEYDARYIDDAREVLLSCIRLQAGKIPRSYALLSDALVCDGSFC